MFFPAVSLLSSSEILNEKRGSQRLLNHEVFFLCEETVGGVRAVQFKGNRATPSADWKLLIRLFTELNNIMSSDNNNDSVNDNDNTNDNGDGDDQGDNDDDNDKNDNNNNI